MVAHNVEMNLVRGSLWREGSRAMHACGDFLLPWDEGPGPRVKAGHCKGYCGDCVEDALIVVHLEGGPPRELWGMEAHADDNQKPCERRGL